MKYLKIKAFLGQTNYNELKLIDAGKTSLEDLGAATFVNHKVQSPSEVLQN